VTHILFICILAVRHPAFIQTEDVFNIDITGPIETEQPAQKKAFIPPPPAIKRHAPAPDDIQPDTIHEQASPARDTPETSTEYSETPETSIDENSIFTHEPESTVPPYFLFDQKTIEKYAEKDPSAEKGLTFNTAEFRHRGYMRLLKEKIESVWKYPKEAAKLGISGDLYIKFAIRRDGTLDKIELIRTSGYSNLDEAVTKALKKAEPYWPLPDDWEGDSLEITGHFIYLFGSTYIM